MITLALDAATYVGTVAVLREGQVIAEEQTAMRGREVERLMPAVAAALASAGIRPGELAQVVCGRGPGSFTSLRIAASIAKGLAAGVGCTLSTVSSLGLIVAGAPQLRAGRYLAVLDAMRHDAYCQPFARGDDGIVTALAPVSLVPLAALQQMVDNLGGARLIAPGSLLDQLSGVAGSGELKAVSAGPHARGVAWLSRAEVQPADIATWEPQYGRLAEAQVKWEAVQGRPLSTA